MNQFKQNLYFYTLLGFVYSFSWFMQSQLFLNWDVSYLLHAAELMLEGGTYAQDFFTPNPPLILYLYLPPLCLHKYLHLNLMLSVQMYVFLLASISLTFCANLSKDIFISKRFFWQTFLILLASVFLILPFYDFGQREHLLFLFTLPYLLVVTRRLQNLSVSPKAAAGAGLLAALGFAIKPQFYILLIFIELYYLFRRKSRLAWLRGETLAIFAVSLIYALILIKAYPDFVWQIAPFVLRNFYSSIGEPWPNLLLNHLIWFCTLPLLLHVLLYKNNPYKELCNIFALALLGFLFSYLSQHTSFYYHLLPGFSMAVLFLGLRFTFLAAQPKFSRRDYINGCVIAVLGFFFLLTQVSLVWLLLIFATTLSFCFFGCLFAFLLVAFPQHLSLQRILISVLSILLVGFLCFFLAQRTSLSSHQVLITILVLLALFGISAPRSRGGVGANIFIAVLGLILFAHPVFFSYSMYSRGLEYKNNVLDTLIGFMHTQKPHQSIYVFSVKGSYGSPLADYTDNHLAQRLDCLWPAVGFLKQGGQGKDKEFFLNMVAQDLQRRKPDLVFVDQHDSKMLAWDKHFNYLQFFSQSPQFKQEWKAYHYLTTLKVDAWYELAVYQRSKESS